MRFETPLHFDSLYKYNHTPVQTCICKIQWNEKLQSSFLSLSGQSGKKTKLNEWWGYLRSQPMPNNNLPELARGRLIVTSLANEKTRIVLVMCMWNPLADPNRSIMTISHAPRS